MMQTSSSKYAVNSYYYSDNPLAKGRGGTKDNPFANTYCNNRSAFWHEGKYYPRSLKVKVIKASRRTDC
jgi:hypothetical protein